MFYDLIWSIKLSGCEYTSLNVERSFRCWQVEMLLRGNIMWTEPEILLVKSWRPVTMWLYSSPITWIRGNRAAHPAYAWNIILRTGQIMKPRLMKCLTYSIRERTQCNRRKKLFQFLKCDQSEAAILWPEIFLIAHLWWVCTLGTEFPQRQHSQHICRFFPIRETGKYYLPNHDLNNIGKGQIACCSTFGAAHF